jgi:hypothetical protein
MGDSASTRSTEPVLAEAASTASTGREDEPIVFDNPGPQIELFKDAVSGGQPVRRWISTFQWMVIATRKGNDMTSTLVRLMPDHPVTFKLDSGGKGGEIRLQHVTESRTFLDIYGTFDKVDGFEQVDSLKVDKWKPNGANAYRITEIVATELLSGGRTKLFKQTYDKEKMIVTFLPTPM